MNQKIDTNFLNGIRPILAFWVAFGHFYKYIGGESLIKIPLLSKLLLSAGPAVDGFMIITGFLMMYHYILRMDKESPYSFVTFKKFWTRRFFRLYPLYFIGIVISYLIFDMNAQFIHENYSYFTGKSADFDTTFNKNNYPNFKDLFLHLTFLHGLLPEYNISLLGPAWSLSTEVQFYFVFPFLFLLFGINKLNFKKHTMMVTLTAIVVTILTIKVFGYWSIPGKLMSFGAPSLITHKISYFIFGMILALTVSNKISKVPLISWLAVASLFQAPIVTVIALVITFFMFSNQLKVYFPTIVNGLIAKIKLILSSKASTFGSDISYSIYLIHMILIPGIVNFVITYSTFSVKINAAISFIAFIAISITISWFLYLIIEKPFIKIGKDIVNTVFNKKNVLASK